MSRTERHPSEPNSAQFEQDKKLADLLMANAIKIPRDGGDTGKSAPEVPRARPLSWLSTVFMMIAIPIALWIYTSSSEDDFYR